MQVDTAAVLRILAHELRSPAGVAQGYLKMVLDGRLSGAAEQQQALEQTRNAVGRIGALSREASDVASWLERAVSPPSQWRTVKGQVLFEAMLARVGDHRVDTSLLHVDEAVVVRTSDEDALVAALAAVTSATIREAPDRRLVLRSTLSDSPARYLDVALAPAELLPAVLQGPMATGAADVPLERGGVGLSLVMALLVFESHGATAWTVGNQRATFGVRIPVEEGFVS